MSNEDQQPLEIHQPCDHCGSSDALSIYEDHSYCHSCENRVWWGSNNNRIGDTVTQQTTAKVIDLPTLDHTKSGPLKDRNITKDTVKFFDVRLEVDHGVVTKHHYPYYNIDGELVAYKTRIVKDKTFPWTGNNKAATLFGQSKFTSGGKYVTICEGEIDAMAAYQMNGSRFPHVATHNAQGAYKLCKKEYEWLDSFENIILCMDNDEPGQKAARQVASLFPKKAKIVKLKHKDAGVYLEKHEEQHFTSAWWAAEQYKPDDILGGSDTMWDILIKPRAEAAFTYPWDQLNKVTYGMRTGEFTIITAGSGMGKTQVLREISHHVLKTTTERIGLIYLEETAWETARGLVSIELSKPTHLPDTHVTDDELREGLEATWGTDRVFTLGDNWRDNNIDYISDKIRYLNKGLDCKLIILDHISFMVSDQSGDERKMLDEIAHKLKSLSVELDIHLLAVCHSKRQTTKPLEEGGNTSLSDLRGTAGLGQLANIVMGLERDGQAEDETQRNTTLVRVLKNRFSGITGPTSLLHYDQFTGRLEETIQEEKE